MTNIKRNEVRSSQQPKQMNLRDVSENEHRRVPVVTEMFDSLVAINGGGTLRRIFFFALCMVFFAVNAAFPADEVPLKGQTLYTRTNLTREGGVIYFHNMSHFDSFIPVGTAVIIMEGTGWGAQIMFKLAQNGRYNVMYVPPQEYRKYFVKDVGEIGLQNFSKEVLENIKNMSIVPGMTKREAYVSRGCPSYIGHGIKSYGHTLSQIMDSDTWYYNRITRKIEMQVTFKNGTVAEVTSYAKGIKSSD